jgi:hypothetical protein
MSASAVPKRFILDGSIDDSKIAAGAGIVSTKLADGANFIKKDGTIPMTGALNMGSQLITNVSTPSSTTDAANKAYVDNLYNNFPNLFKNKDEAKAMMTTNVTISNPATAVFDGVTLTANDRLVLTGQTAPAENGIYVFNGSSSALTRSADADSFAEIAGALIGVAAGGTTNGSKVLFFTNTSTGTLGSTAVTTTVINSTPGLLASNFVDDETPSGTPNGVLVTFTLANTPIAGSVKLYIEGIRLTVGAGNDYTISGANITMLTAPLTGEKLRADYRK